MGMARCLTIIRGVCVSLQYLYVFYIVALEFWSGKTIPIINAHKLRSVLYFRFMENEKTEHVLCMITTNTFAHGHLHFIVWWAPEAYV